uniref:Dynein regulatory complex protein 1/2 N-terminal domain-containing protein n=1 Tax=Glossina palpalis gambiensis TaxID=67801 RepID=A0A1B0C6K7_9MUSC
MVVNEQLERQKEAIFQLFKSKDEMTERCQKELKRVNEKYLVDQTKQSADIYFMIKRIDNQTELMKGAYKENIYELQNTIDNEREKFQDESNRKWRDPYIALTIKLCSPLSMNNSTMSLADFFETTQSFGITARQN